MSLRGNWIRKKARRNEMKTKTKLQILLLSVIMIQFFFPINLFSESDNTHPVRLMFFYSVDIKIPESQEFMRESFIQAVKNVKDAIENSQYPSSDIDPDPQKFELSRIYISPNDEIFHDYFNVTNQQYMYSNDVTVEVLDYEISQYNGPCPATHYTDCAPGRSSAWVLIRFYNILKDCGLSHELGHAMGCDHGIYSREDCPGNPAYGHAWNIYLGINDNWGTAVAYTSPGKRLPYYSNPNITWKGYQIGDNDRFNAKVIYDTKTQIRNLCTTPDDVTTVPYSIPTGYTGEEIKPWEFADAIAQEHLSTSSVYHYIVDENAIVQFRAGSQVHIKNGFHAKSGSLFRAFISDLRTRGIYGRKTTEGKEINAEKMQQYFENSITGLYPNPASKTLHLDYSVGEKSNIRIFIRDLLGNNFILLNSDKFQSKGNYGIDIDVGNLATGKYFLLLDFGNSIQVRQFLIVK